MTEVGFQPFSGHFLLFLYPTTAKLFAVKFKQLASKFFSMELKIFGGVLSDFYGQKDFLNGF